MTELDEFLEKKDRVLRDLDVDAFYELAGVIKSPDPKHARMVALVSMHKTRYETTTMPAELRHASRNWLESNGFSRMDGFPWPPVGVLEDGRGGRAY